MILIKDKFDLLKNVPNILHLSQNAINTHSIKFGVRRLYLILQLNKDRLKHFSKESIINQLLELEKSKKLVVVNIPDYGLHISYNEPTQQIIFNISPFDVEDIYSEKPGVSEYYAQLVYGLTFYNLVTEKLKVKDSYFVPISGFILGLLIGIFGKEYGLLGTYTANITKLNFLINCYVLSSFFGITGKSCYDKASTVSTFNYTDIKSELDNCDFSKIENFITYLSDFKVFPGINKYSFTGKILRMTSVNFLPALEDLSRFIAIISCMEVKGSHIIPNQISKYNLDSFERLTQISKLVFKK